ncbi:MAG: hypothetical protein V1834_03395 [Candidatus Micrarchaeota archaeon]
MTAGSRFSSITVLLAVLLLVSGCVYGPIDLDSTPQPTSSVAPAPRTILRRQARCRLKNLKTVSR